MASRITDSGAITPSLETSLVTSSPLSSSQSWVIKLKVIFTNKTKIFRFRLHFAFAYKVGFEF